MDRIAAIIPAAGQGTRFGEKIPKQFIAVLGKPLLFWTIRAVIESNLISYFIVVLPKNDFKYYSDTVKSWLRDLPGFPEKFLMITVPGGAERQESVWEGIKKLPGDTDWVVIHDGARPMASSELFHRVFKKASLTGAAIAATSVRDTVKRAERFYGETVVNSTVDRSVLWLAQTPQIFRRELIVKAYEEALESNFTGTDDASLVERINHPVSIVEGDPLNIKITSKEDMEWLIWHLQKKIVK